MKSPLDTQVRAYEMDTEADVLLIFASECGTIIVEPYWECETSPEDLESQLLTACIYYADTLSQGAVRGQIVDKRSKQQQT